MSTILNDYVLDPEFLKEEQTTNMKEILGDAWEYLEILERLEGAEKKDVRQDI